VTNSAMGSHNLSEVLEITGGGRIMETLMGMQAEHPGKAIRLHLDTYIQEVLAE
jgi:hypothetical protein